VAEAIAWERHDLAISFPAGSFDLVSACYVHSPVQMPGERVLRSAAAAVAPGGTLASTPTLAAMIAPPAAHRTTRIRDP